MKAHGSIPTLTRVFLVVLILITVVTRLQAEPASRPNILLIVADQMRGSALGIAGNPDVQTPHLDRLGREGVVFRRTYANVPVCCPARAILLTGTYPHVNGMVANDLRLRESEVTLAEILRERGYRTGFVGKWHLDGGVRVPGFVPPGPRRQGFDFWAAYQCHHQHFLPWYFRDTPEMILVPKFEAEASCDFAEEFLRTQPRERPFFLSVQMGPPHDPYGAPSDYMKRYAPEKLTMPENWQPGSETRPERPAIPANLRRPGMPDAVYVKTGGREELAAYYAAITAIDDQVGRLMRVLREIGQDENTIVLFTSDHGDMLGSHGMRRKRKPHDESARVPGLLRFPPKVPARRALDTLFSHVDMAPTLLGLAGAPVPPHMQGVDLSPIARGEPAPQPEAVLLQLFVPFRPDGVEKPWRGIVTPRYTFARFEDEPWVLFDRVADPSERTNLAQEPRARGVREELERQLEALMRRHGDDWTFNRSEHVEQGGGLYRDQVYHTVDEYLAVIRAKDGNAR